MITLQQRCHFILLALCLALSSGCASVDRQRMSNPDPDARLNELLEQYSNSRQSGKSCHDQASLGQPVLDCQRLPREFDRLYAEFPNHERVIMANAVVHFDLGNRDNSQFLLDQLLSRPGPHPEAAILRSRIAVEEGNTARAKQLLQSQIVFAPDYAELHETLAAVFYLEGKYIDSGRELELAAMLGSPIWRLAYHRGLIQEALGNRELACHEYQVALQTQPKFRPALARLLGLADDPACKAIFQAYRGPDRR